MALLHRQGTYQLGEISHVASGLEESFHYDKPPSELLASLFLDDLLHDTLEVLHIIVIVPADDATRDLETPTNWEVDAPVSDDNIATLAEGRDNAGDGREGVCVDKARLGAKIVGDIGLGLHVDVLGTVELRRATGTNTIGAEGLNGLLLDLLIGVEVVEVVRRKVDDSLAVGQLDLWARWACSPLVFRLLPFSASRP